MSIKSEIERLKRNVAAAYSALADNGATMPAVQNSDNLAETAATTSEKMNKVNPTGSGTMTFDGNADFSGGVSVGGSAVALQADIAKTVYAAASNSSPIYVKVSDFGAWGTGVWYQKGFSMLLTSRAGELVWVSLAANDSATTAKAFRLIDAYSKINALYYSASESALYCRMVAWCNNLCAHILTNINGDYVPTVSQASALPDDAVEINIVEFGVSSSGTQVGDTSVNLLLGGAAERPTYNGTNVALSSDIPGTETWTFELEDGSTVTKAVCVR